MIGVPAVYATEYVEVPDGGGLKNWGVPCITGWTTVGSRGQTQVWLCTTFHNVASSDDLNYGVTVVRSDTRNLSTTQSSGLTSFIYFNDGLQNTINQNMETFTLIPDDGYRVEVYADHCYATQVTGAAVLVFPYHGRFDAGVTDT